MVEWKRYGTWRHISNILWMVGRSYDTFGCLFGVRNSANFTPLFDGRGFPDDRSGSLEDRIEQFGGEGRIGAIDFHSPSYFTLDEIAEVDWEETADTPGGRMSVVDESGECKLKAGYIAGVHESLSNEELERARNGERVRLSDTEGEARYAVHEQQTRKDALSGAWQWLLFEYLPVLGERSESEQDVRLTVWFDN